MFLNPLFSAYSAESIQLNIFSRNDEELSPHNPFRLGPGRRPARSLDETRRGRPHPHVLSHPDHPWLLPPHPHGKHWSRLQPVRRLSLTLEDGSADRVLPDRNGDRLRPAVEAS